MYNGRLYKYGQGGYRNRVKRMQGTLVTCILHRQQLVLVRALVLTEGIQGR